MERYTSLTPEQQEARLAELTELYWNAMDYLASIATERAMLMNEMQEHRNGTATV